MDAGAEGKSVEFEQADGWRNQSSWVRLMLESSASYHPSAPPSCLLRSEARGTQPVHEVNAVLEAASVCVCLFLESKVNFLGRAVLWCPRRDC